MHTYIFYDIFKNIEQVHNTGMRTINFTTMSTHEQSWLSVLKACAEILQSSQISVIPYATKEMIINRVSLLMK